jgi:hypothetical protein
MCAKYKFKRNKHRRKKKGITTRVFGVEHKLLLSLFKKKKTVAMKGTTLMTIRIGFNSIWVTLNLDMIYDSPII